MKAEYLSVWNKNVTLPFIVWTPMPVGFDDVTTLRLISKWNKAGTIWFHYLSTRLFCHWTELALFNPTCATTYMPAEDVTWLELLCRTLVFGWRFRHSFDSGHFATVIGPVEVCPYSLQEEHLTLLHLLDFLAFLPLYPIPGGRCSKQNLSYTGIVWTIVNPYDFREAIWLWRKNPANANKHNNIILKLYRDWFCLKEVVIEFSMLLSSTPCSTPSSTLLELLVLFSF